MRDYKLYVKDIETSISKINTYTCKLNLKTFKNNDLVVDAVIRNLEIIGESVKSIPQDSEAD